MRRLTPCSSCLVEPHFVERILGHQPPGLQKVYQRGTYDDAAADAWRRWSEHIEAVPDSGAAPGTPHSRDLRLYLGPPTGRPCVI